MTKLPQVSVRQFGPFTREEPKGERADVLSQAVSVEAFVDPYRNAGMTSSPKSRMDFSISAGSMLPKLCVVASRS